MKNSHATLFLKGDGEVTIHMKIFHKTTKKKEGKIVKTSQRRENPIICRVGVRKEFFTLTWRIILFRTKQYYWGWGPSIKIFMVH